MKFESSCQQSIARNDTKERTLYMVTWRINIKVYLNLKGKKHLENVSYCKIEENGYRKQRSSLMNKCGTLMQNMQLFCYILPLDWSYNTSNLHVQLLLIKLLHLFTTTMYFLCHEPWEMWIAAQIHHTLNCCSCLSYSTIYHLIVPKHFLTNPPLKRIYNYDGHTSSYFSPLLHPRARNFLSTLSHTINLWGK
jgi:hypothetical protein